MDGTSTVLIIGGAWLALLLLGFLVWFVVIRPGRKAKREQLDHEAAILAPIAGRPEILTQDALDEAVRAENFNIFGVSEFLRSGSTLPPQFSSSWLAVLRGETIPDLAPMIHAALFEFRGWQFLAAETGVLDRRGHRPTRLTFREQPPEGDMLTQLADLTGDYLVDIAGSDAVCATHLMALLPAPAPTTALWPESNRALDEGDRTSGLTTVPIGVQMFDATWTILTADPLFARTAFGPPFIEQLLAAHQQGTVSRLLFKGNVVHVAVKGRIGHSNHQPFVVYLAHLLPYINPQVWRTPHSSPGPAAPPPSAR